jgi:predicted PurR-regulated permease PerM
LVNLAFTIVYRLFEDYVLSPRILKRTGDVEPAVTIIAVPVAAVVQL